MPLPTLVVIGAMKCGTTALHRYLDAHPQVGMAPAKEVDFFDHHWERGPEWYAAQLPEAPVVGEATPGYTSPDHPAVAERMARLVPEARLVYLVREPLARAVSQYRHHVRDGAEPRPLEEALLDPGGHYVLRSRYHERLLPFLDQFDRDQVLVVVSERLREHCRDQLGRVFRHVGADPDWWGAELESEWHVGDAPDEVPAPVAAAFHAQVRDDADRFRGLLEDPIPEWFGAGV